MKTLFLISALLVTACHTRENAKEEVKFKHGKVMTITRSINGVGVANDKWAFVMKDDKDVLFYCVVNEETADAYQKSIYRNRKTESYACPIDNVREMK